jgi:dihydropteroate synthase
VKADFLGIVNCTPDSFSDGGAYATEVAAVSHARELHAQGAHYIDIGGDASGPGSVCVGAEAEWLRIEPVLSALTPTVPCSVDTHHSETARRAIKAGAVLINDVSGGMDSAMFSVIADSTARYICMFSCWSAPHVFSTIQTSAVLDLIYTFFDQVRKRAFAAGIQESQLLFDPGMGAFLSPDPEVSWEVLRAVPEFVKAGFPMVVGLSRKRFLRTAATTNGRSLDEVSALVAREVRMACPSEVTIYFRVHNVAVHQSIFSATDTAFPVLVPF